MRRWFSPFRIRLFLALPLVACLVLAIRWGEPGSRLPGMFSWSWSNPAAQIGGVSLDEYTKLLGHAHERNIQLIGVEYDEEFFDAAAPPPYTSQWRYRRLQIHIWVVAVISTAPLWIYHFMTRKRRWAAARISRGLCATCGYDLRAHAPGNNCPECGTPVPDPRNAAVTRA